MSALPPRNPKRIPALFLVPVLLLAWGATPANGVDGQVGSRSNKEDTLLTRFPDIRNHDIVFSYAGDIWRSTVWGGDAVRLTSHPGLELFPKFSPDGRTIAFTGQIDGDEQVYTMSVRGGAPTQLTYYPAKGPLPSRWGYDNQVCGWNADGTEVIFRSLRGSWNLSEGRLYSVPIGGGLPRVLSIRSSGSGEYAPNGSWVAFSYPARDFRTWKRYRGGMAQDIYLFDENQSYCRNISRHGATDRDPVWIQDKLFFVSDRNERRMNLFAYDPMKDKGGEGSLPPGSLFQVTNLGEWDVQWASGDGISKIIYEYGGGLRYHDFSTTPGGEGRKTSLDLDRRNLPDPNPIPVKVPTDALAARKKTLDVSPFLREFQLSPDGERALFVARGDIFSTKIRRGVPRNLTRSSWAHDRGARWSPDGTKIAFVSDRDPSKEERLYWVDAFGRKEPVPLTEPRPGLSTPAWSPDGTELVASDKDGRLFVVRLDGGPTQEIDEDERGVISDASWSPDGTFLAFTKSTESGLRSIYLWSRSRKKSVRITDELTHDFCPRWDPRGQYLYYLGDREFGPRMGELEWDFQVDRPTRVYALALRSDVPTPFPLGDEPDAESSPQLHDPAKAPRTGHGSNGPRIPRVQVGKNPDDRATASSANSTSRPSDGRNHPVDRDHDPSPRPSPSPKETTGGPTDGLIELEGLGQRVIRIPLDPDNYDDLQVRGGLLFLTTKPAIYYGRDELREDRTLLAFDPSRRQRFPLSKAHRGYATSRDGATVLIRENESFVLYSRGQDGKSHRESLPPFVLRTEIDPRLEWEQIFHEAWRRFRDYFYVENMHGFHETGDPLRKTPWERLRSRYSKLLSHVNHRSDLNYLIGDMIAELEVSHAYVSGGDFVRPSRPPAALPGVEFELDPSVNRYRIAKILPGQNEIPHYRSPLTEVGIEAREGLYLLAIDGEQLTGDQNPYRFLRRNPEAPVHFTVSEKPDGSSPRELRFRPISDESHLRYYEWVTANRDKVDKATRGRAGYVHLPDMGANGLREFIRTYYGQIRKEGLIIDIRHNAGGNVSQIILERLMRRPLLVSFGRTTGRRTYPDRAFHGHMVGLINETSASDADLFAAVFKEAGLGTLVGKRTWGGVIGVTDHGPLIDGGSIAVPEFWNLDLGLEAEIEGVGVKPDIVVDSPPCDATDRQLEEAIVELKRKMREDPRRLPVSPPKPKNRRFP